MLKVREETEYPIIDIKRTGWNLKRICKERNISAVKLQTFLGLSCPQTVYHWFSGKTILSVFICIGKSVKLAD